MSQQIPKTFHFIFGLQKAPQKLHLVHYLCLRSCIEVHAPEEVFLYYHREPYGQYWDLIKDQLKLEKADLVPEVLNYRYKKSVIPVSYRYAHHSDFLRVEVVNNKGGIYADIDTIFIKPFPQEFYAQEYLMGREPTIFCAVKRKQFESICNALIMGRADSRFGKLYHERMAAELDGSWSNHSCILAHTLSQEMPDCIHVEPSRSFYKHVWSPEGVRMLLTDYDSDYSGMYSMHLWAHLWWSKWRMDNTTFHAGMMTEEYVRTVDTTYNVVARRFLPPKRRRLWFVAKELQAHRQGDESL